MSGCAIQRYSALFIFFRLYRWFTIIWKKVITRGNSRSALRIDDRNKISRYSLAQYVNSAMRCVALKRLSACYKACERRPRPERRKRINPGTYKKRKGLRQKERTAFLPWNKIVFFGNLGTLYKGKRGKARHTVTQSHRESVASD